MLKRKHPSLLRNKNIADIFFSIGYIEAWGRGIFMIMDTCRKAGLPEPTIEEVAGGMQITFLKDIFSEDYLKRPGLNVRQIEAVLYTRKYREITNSKYQEVAGVSKATATRDIKELEDKGLLKNIGTKGSSAIYKLGVGS